MARDARLEGPRFRALVNILKEALSSDSTINTIIIQLGAKSGVSRVGSPEDQWTSLLDYAAERPEVLDELLSIIDEYLKPTVNYPKFLLWRGLSTQSDYTKLVRAVADVRKALSSLLALSDPRQGGLSIQAMRIAIMEIKDTIESLPDKAPGGPLILPVTAGEVAAARSDVLFACGDALREIDQLVVDIEEAKHQSARARQAYGGQEAFAMNRSMTRHLLEDRGLVDLESQALLQVIGEQLAHLGIPVPEPEKPGQVAPQPRVEP